MRSTVRNDAEPGLTPGRADSMPGRADSMLGRALTLLWAFTPVDDELTLAQLCRRTGVTKPTAHRLLAELAEWGLIERGTAGVRLGMGLFELGARAPVQLSLRKSAAPVLADLAEATRETVHLAVLQGVDVVYVQKLDGRHGPSLATRIGGRMPAYCTGVGKALLAFGPAEQVDAVVAAGLVRRTPHTVIAEGLLRRQFDVIRKKGYAEEHEESTRGITCVAAPVLDSRGVAVAAVSITGWASRLNAARMVPAVRTAALGIARRLTSEPSANAGR